MDSVHYTWTTAPRHRHKGSRNSLDSSNTDRYSAAVLELIIVHHAYSILFGWPCTTKKYTEHGRLEVVLLQLALFMLLLWSRTVNVGSFGHWIARIRITCSKWLQINDWPAFVSSLRRTASEEVTSLVFGSNRNIYVSVAVVYQWLVGTEAMKLVVQCIYSWHTSDITHFDSVTAHVDMRLRKGTQIVDKIGQKSDLLHCRLTLYWVISLCGKQFTSKMNGWMRSSMLER